MGREGDRQGAWPGGFVAHGFNSNGNSRDPVKSGLSNVTSPLQKNGTESFRAKKDLILMLNRRRNPLTCGNVSRGGSSFIFLFMTSF